MNKHHRGFTLLEVMVAILLMSIVSLIAWRGLDSVTRTDARLRENTEQTESLLRAFNQLERDMALRASIECRNRTWTAIRTTDLRPRQRSACVPLTQATFVWT